MVHDEIDGDDVGRREARHVLPGAEARIDLAMVGWVEARIGTIERGEERQEVDACEHTCQRPGQEIGDGREVTVAEAVDVCDELGAIAHGASVG